MSIAKVQSYMDKYSENLPKPNGSKVKLEGGGRVKGTKLDEWRKRGLEGGVCGKCSVQVKRLTVDHIVPVHVLSSLDEAFEIATNDEENFQFLCEICNRAKSGILDMRNPKTAPLLLKYITPYLND